MALTAGFVRSGLKALLVVVAVYYAVWGGEYSAFDLLRLSRMQVEEQAALAATREQADSLRLYAARLADDPATIERVARERFGMIRQGEVLYRFVAVDSTAVRGVQVAASP